MFESRFFKKFGPSESQQHRKVITVQAKPPHLLVGWRFRRQMEVQW
jgi:hypothetical protein